jgi:hypothetical protein
MVRIASSCIAAAGYNPEDGSLDVMFRGGRSYRYAGVRPSLYRALLTELARGASAGRFFAHYIRRSFPCVSLHYVARAEEV